MPVEEATAADLCRALNDLAPTARRLAGAAEHRRVLADEIVQALFAAGLFRVWIPRRYGGRELSLPAVLEIYEAAAHIDGSLGWTVMIGAGGGLFAAYLEPATARELFGPPTAVVAGSGAPHGTAERVAGGYRVNGRWRYASGAPHASVFTANCVVTTHGMPLRDAVGTSLIRAMAFLPAEVTIIETWNSSGMRGTASHDIAVTDVFVPERRSFSLADVPTASGPLYRLPFEVLTELPVAAVALGIARHALDAYAEFARAKTVPPVGAPLAADVLAGAAYARADACWRLSRAGLRELAAHAWDTVTTGGTLDPAARAAITAACAETVGSLRAAIDGLAAHAGMMAIERDAAFARAWQDLLALAAHFAVGPRQLGAAGVALLGGMAMS